MFDEGDDDKNSLITFIQGVNLKLLIIEAFVDLAKPKIDPAVPRFRVSHIICDFQPQARSSKWLVENVQWVSNEDFDW